MVKGSTQGRAFSLRSFIRGDMPSDIYRPTDLNYTSHTVAWDYPLSLVHPTHLALSLLLFLSNPPWGDIYFSFLYSCLLTMNLESSSVARAHRINRNPCALR